MSTIQTVTETLIRLAKQTIHPDTVLVFPDDLFEVQRTPSVILQGPKLAEDRFRRSQSRLFEKNVAELSFEECRFPRLYHLDFDLVVTGRPNCSVFTNRFRGSSSFTRRSPSQTRAA